MRSGIQPAGAQPMSHSRATHFELAAVIWQDYFEKRISTSERDALLEPLREYLKTLK